MWACQARQVLAWYWSSPQTSFACWKHSSTFHLVPAIQAKSVRLERRGP
jgi:hypothetical protein